MQQDSLSPTPQNDDVTPCSITLLQYEITRLKKRLQLKAHPADMPCSEEEQALRQRIQKLETCLMRLSRGGIK